LLLARDVGQVRDVLRRAETAELAEQVHPTVEEAVAAAGGGRPGDPAHPRQVSRSGADVGRVRSMGQVIGDLLPLALGVAISPVPIMAVILMLLAPKAGGTSTGFLIGWVAGIVIATVVFVVVASVTGLEAGGEPSAASSWIKIALGVVLVALAVVQWRGRPHDGEQPTMPGWMTAIDTFTPLKAIGLGFLLAAVNPKNLAMAIAAGVAIGGSGLPTGPTVVAIAVFTVLAASTVAAPVIAYAVASGRMAKPLDSLRRWLVDNNATVMATLLLVIGVVLAGKGIAGLG
jgi:threonine/homoserine/homoserine lactone efflux protein